MEGKRIARRKHSKAFKAASVVMARAPGASVAAVALSRGINANLLRRWIQEAGGKSTAVKTTRTLPEVVAPAFVPVAMPVRSLAPEVAPEVGTGADIRIELRRGATVVSVMWPVAAAGECSAWLQQWLR
jgi:transposase